MDNTTQNIYETSLTLLENPKEISLIERSSATVASTSSRVVEVPWSAACLGRLKPSRLLDVGFSLASIDYLGLLLGYAKRPKTTLCAVDIVKPERVRTRYPEAWWSQIESLDVRQADIRANPKFDQLFDAITCVSVIEHIGFDKASKDNPDSAFVRQKDPGEVNTIRPSDVDKEVMAAMAKLLASNGRLIISVPMGKGGPVILRDSLGYYCVQWEYSPHDWENLIHGNEFILEEELFYGVDDDLIWKRVNGPADLAALDAVHLSHSRGVGMAVLRKA
nr:hypothetical protein [uncultured Pseudodesulfovibrio sp.]